MLFFSDPRMFLMFSLILKKGRQYSLLSSTVLAWCAQVLSSIPSDISHIWTDIFLVELGEEYAWSIVTPKADWGVHFTTLSYFTQSCKFQYLKWGLCFHLSAVEKHGHEEHSLNLPDSCAVSWTLENVRNDKTHVCWQKNYFLSY